MASATSRRIERSSSNIKTRHGAPGLASNTLPTEGVSTPTTRAWPARYSSCWPPKLAHLAPWATRHTTGPDRMWLGGLGWSERMTAKPGIAVKNGLSPVWRSE